VTDDLYAQGWRQGTIFRKVITAVVAGRENVEYDRWIVCSQDCDLSAASTQTDGTIVEVRPVLTEDTPSDWGIRSRRLILRDSDYVDAAYPRAQITAAELSNSGAAREEPLPDDRIRAFKTWLGRRYDRPAVPEHLVAFAQEVAKRCGVRSGREVAKSVHDVLMQFNEDAAVRQVALFAVITDDAEPAEVERWLADAASRIDPSLGVVSQIVAITRASTSLQLLETTYSADLSQLTWRGESPEGAD